ncbi:unnamed protein product [Thlaspi arvense]|uniref:Uncharacterized protein n=1 Tax=Thlaspi arvense TaxID=13288 RepID=A0AAU9SUK4_THLAR|nr:unnamed protein product [Thlaspi arvense]
MNKKISKTSYKKNRRSIYQQSSEFLCCNTVFDEARSLGSIMYSSVTSSTLQSWRERSPSSYSLKIQKLLSTPKINSLLRRKIPIKSFLLWWIQLLIAGTTKQIKVWDTISLCR